MLDLWQSISHQMILEISQSIYRYFVLFPSVAHHLNSDLGQPIVAFLDHT
jgi:hypothetical protein